MQKTQNTVSRYENTGCQEANELLKVFLLQATFTDSLTHN